MTLFISSVLGAFPQKDFKQRAFWEGDFEHTLLKGRSGCIPHHTHHVPLQGDSEAMQALLQRARAGHGRVLPLASFDRTAQP